MSDRKENNKAARARLMRMDRSVLADSALQLGCIQNPLLASKDELVERILDSSEFRADFHLAPVTTLEWLLRNQEHKQELDARFEEKVEPLRRTSRYILGFFATVGTVGTVLIGISSLSGFNLNGQLQELHKQLQEQRKTFVQNREQLKEDQRDLAKVRNELRQERRAAQRQWARLHHFYLKSENSSFQKAFERILYVSLEHGSTELMSVLKEIGSDIERWGDLVESKDEPTDTIPLETKRDLKILEMHIEFIKAIRQFAEWKDLKPSKDWSITKEKWAKFRNTLITLQHEHGLNLDKRNLLDNLAQKSPLADFKLFDETIENDLKNEVTNLQTKLDGSRTRYREKEKIVQIFRKALAFTYAVLSQMERWVPTADKNTLKNAIDYAIKAIHLDSSNAQYYSELARNYRKIAELSKPLEEKNEYFKMAEDTLIKAMKQSLSEAGLAAKDEIILRNNIANNYMKWALLSPAEHTAKMRIHQGIDQLDVIFQKRFAATGKIREYALTTRAELMISLLFIDVAGYTKVKAAWGNKDMECLELQEPLLILFKDFINRNRATPKMQEEFKEELNKLQISLEEQEWGDDIIALKYTYQRVSKIYGDLARAGDSGDIFFRGKKDEDLQNMSPQFCSFKKLVERSQDLSESDRTPRQLEQNLQELLSEIRIMFRFKAAEAPTWQTK